jgi:hypothetical protein
MRFLKKIFLLLLFFYANNIFAQVSFTIKTQSKEIGKADILQAEYAVSNANNVGQIITPVFTDWNVASGPEFSQQSVSINGQTQSTTSYIYDLSPKRTGDLNVPATSITADGKKLTCAAITIHVSNQLHLASAQSQQSIIPVPAFPDDLQQDDVFAQNNILKPDEKPDEKIRKNIFVKVSANKTSCFVGEPILVTYQLFSALESQSKINKEPSFSGCSVIEMTNPNEQSTVQKINGKAYKVFTVRRVQLIPLQEGELKLDTASVDNEVSFSSPENSYQTQTYSATLASNPLVIEVKKLPENNKPSNFTGVVGKFEISAKADSNSIPLGENNNLQISIHGEGNFEDINTPQVQWPEELQHFDGTDSQQVDKSVFPMSGDKIFNIPFIGTKEGTDTIHAVSFSFFDAGTQTYQTIHSSNIIVTITKALPKSDKFKNIVTEDITNTKYLWIVGAIAIIVAFVFIMTNKKTTRKIVVEKNEKAIVPKEEKAVPVFKMKTDFAQEFILLENKNDNPEFFMQAKKLLTLALQEKTDSTSNISTALVSALKQQTQNEELAKDAQNIFTVCDRYLYSPIMSEEEKIVLQEQLRYVVKSMEL